MIHRRFFRAPIAGPRCSRALARSPPYPLAATQKKPLPVHSVPVRGAVSPNLAVGARIIAGLSAEPIPTRRRWRPCQPCQSGAAQQHQASVKSSNSTFAIKSSRDLDRALTIFVLVLHDGPQPHQGKDVHYLRTPSCHTTDNGGIEGAQHAGICYLCHHQSRAFTHSHICASVSVPVLVSQKDKLR